MDTYYQIECSNCHFFNDITEYTCNHCGTPLPDTINVRRASLPIEVNALEIRYKNAREYLKTNALTSSEYYIQDEIKNRGKGVINTHSDFLWEWLFYNRTSYQSYRRQLINNQRLKAKFKNDCRRSIIDSILFGSDSDIIYAALSVNEAGLISYGEITIILKTYAIERRTSSLERNSYQFIDDCEANGWTLSQPIPPGYMSTWPNICKLLLAKLHKKVKKDLNLDEFASLILNSTGDRASDEFVELYIWGKIIGSAIEKIKIPVTLADKYRPKEKAMLKELQLRYDIEIY